MDVLCFWNSCADHTRVVSLAGRDHSSSPRGFTCWTCRQSAASLGLCVQTPPDHSHYDKVADSLCCSEKAFTGHRGHHKVEGSSTFWTMPVSVAMVL